MKYFIQGFPGGSDGKESACNAEDLGSSPGLGRFLGEVNGYPLYYAFLENSINFCPKNIHHHLADVEFFFFSCSRHCSSLTIGLQNPASPSLRDNAY